MTESVTYYDILGIKDACADKEILDAYLNEAVKVHPDLINTHMERADQVIRFKKLSLAFTALSDSANRAAYDNLSKSLQQACASRLSPFRLGSELDVSENDACTIWETACISRGMPANKVLREYVSKQKATLESTGSPGDDVFVDVTVTPEKSASTASKVSDIVVEKPKLTIEDLIRSVKFSMRTEITRILFHYPEMVNELDSGGYTAVHWAAKAGNVLILQTLHINGAKLNVPSSSEHSMMPLHWAASDGKLGAIRYLLDNHVSINVQDGNGCTPVVIAAQHDQQACVAFFIKNGADMNLRDSNGDTALHWAAYKGFVELIGLLTHTCPGAIDADDDYGQTPLHLAALRGNVDAVEYLVMDCQANMTKKDKNGLTPLDLAIKKNQLKCEWALRRLSSRNTWELIQQLEIKRLTDGRILQNVLFAANDREMSAWPWRIVFASNFIGTCYSLFFAFHESMSDLWLLHMLNTALQSCWWFCFWMCLQKGVSDVYDPRATPGGEIGMYDAALELIGKRESDANLDDLPHMCHTCHVVRPLRSKHCKIQRCCINKFDHFCPFVYNTVCRDNYKYFIGVVVIHLLGSIFWLITAFTLASRITISWFLTFYIIYLLLWMLMLGGLLQFHISIIVKNLTTNEQMNIQKGKYKHFFDQHSNFDNPFDLGDTKLNVWDGLFPQSVQMYTREEAKAEQRRRKNSSYEGTDQESLLDASSHGNR